MFVIEGRFPGLNDYQRTCRASYKAGNGMKRKYTQMVREAAEAAHEPKHWGKVNVAVRWVEPNRRRDKDNIRFAMKFVLDGLVKAGVIQNDTWEFIGSLWDAFAVDPERPRVEVIVTECKEV